MTGSRKIGEVAPQSSQDYKVANITLFAPSNKRLRIVTIGAGVSGIMMAYKMQKELKNMDYVMYEKNHDIGGTWLLNRYPGCACDIPSHAYTYSFALNPDWPSFFSPSPEIWKYLDKVVEKWNLRKYMKFNTEVIKCQWDESSAKWKLSMRRTDLESGKSTDFQDECDVLLHATGVLNKFKWPEIKGLEKFKGKVVHTARWPEEYQKEEWAKETIAVIGSGASSIQTVPQIQPHVPRMEIFIRTPVWFVDIAGNEGKNMPYSEHQKRVFNSEPAELVKHAKFLEDQVNGVWSVMLKDTPESQAARELFEERTAGIIKDKRLLEGIIPKFSVGCRRITPGDPYMEAIQKPNVNVHFEEVVEITEKTIIGSKGTEKEIDTIICATGFDTSFRPNFPIIGRNGIDLAQKWDPAPEGYFGLAVPDFPNFFTFIGPSWPIGNGSVMGPLETVGDYVVQFLTKMQNEMIRTFEPKQEITDMFNEHVQVFMQDTVWMDDCRSWYKDPKTNRVNAIWPGASLHYIEAIQAPRYEDFKIEYTHKNVFTYLGRGFTQTALVENGDKSPYLTLDRIDRDWLEDFKPADRANL